MRRPSPHADTRVLVAGIAAALSGVGLIQAHVAAGLAKRFSAHARGQGVVPEVVRDRRGSAGESATPPITILKPLCGEEPLLEQALATICAQRYPAFQVVFGVQDARDRALPVVARLRQQFPHCDIAVVVNLAQHGSNRKVSNLINIFPAAKHDLLVIADSDVHAEPDYLARLAATLAEPETGLVTTLYAGLPSSNRLAAKLGAMQITHNFLPGALLARALGRQDCLGATMAFRRETLAQAGGLGALVDHLADDQVLGRRVRALGCAVRLAPTIPATTVPETDLGSLIRHELRWARTIRTLVPAAFAASLLQYPIFWALCSVALSAGALWSLAAFALAWALRAWAARRVDGALLPMLRGLAFACPVWLLPLRDLISIGVMVASYLSRTVDWRGHRLIADTPAPLVPGFAASKEMHPR